MPPHRRTFSISAIGLSYGIASVAFHTVAQPALGPVASSGSHMSLWLLAVAAIGLLRWTVNQGLVLPAIKGADPAMRIRDLLLARERVQNDVAELCVAVLVTLGIAVSLLTVVFALPFVTLLQRSVRHTQLVNASRSTPRPACSTPVPGSARRPGRWRVLSVLVPP